MSLAARSRAHVASRKDHLPRKAFNVSSGIISGFGKRRGVKMDAELKSEVFLTNVTDDDCGVIAFQAVTGASRKRSMELLKEAYVAGVGTARSRLMQALLNCGYEFEAKEVQPGEHTVALFASTYDYGTYMIWVENHVTVLRDGDLLNAGGWNDVIYHIDKITKRGQI